MAEQDRSARLFGARILFVADSVSAPAAAQDKTPAQPDQVLPPVTAPSRPDVRQSPEWPGAAGTASDDGKPPAPIVVIPGPNGLTITSEDLDALDEFERMLAAASHGSGDGPMKVYFLKYAKAQDVAEELEKFLATRLVWNGRFLGS